MSLSDIFNADSWKSAYDKNYYAPGTQEYEAHSIIEPKLREEFKVLADKEYDKLTAGKNKMLDGGLLSKTVSCSNCGWSWESVDGGADPLTCHKCGGTAKMKNGGYPIMQKGGWSGGGLSRFNLETMAGLNKNVDYKKKYAHDYDTKKTVEDVSVKEGYKDMRNFMDYWLTERAKDPKFTEWANKRLSVLNNLSGKYKTFTNKDIETGKAPYNALAFYNPEDSSLNFNTDQSSTYSAPVQLHELSHKMDYEDSTFYEKPRYFWDSNDYTTPSNFISKQVIPKNKEFTNDRYAGDNDEYSYLSRPTEINARLNEFRYHYNLDPKKKYTAEDMKKIINDHNKYNESFKGSTDYHYKSKQNYFGEKKEY